MTTKIKKFLKSESGFTLIELLVVIGIIAILATIGAINFSGARAKARDGKRQADINQIGASFEAAAAGSVDGLYPTTVPAEITSAAVTPPGSAGDQYCYVVTSARTTFYVATPVEDSAVNGLKDKGYETDITTVVADTAGEIGSGPGTSCPVTGTAGTIDCDDSGSNTYCARGTTVL